MNMVPMTKLEHDLLTNKYTTVYYGEGYNFNAPHTFSVTAMKDKVNGEEGQEEVVIQTVKFQDGPIAENGINGVSNEDLIAMVIKRLECFNESDYRCRENSAAITKFEEGLMWLRKRTMGREKRGVEGTHIK